MKYVEETGKSDSDSDGSTGNNPKETSWISKNDWGRYTAGDDPEDCSFGINKNLKKRLGTVKGNNGFP